MGKPSLELVGETLDLDRVVLLVVGAHLRAEVADRPIAYRLRDAILAWMEEACELDDETLPPVDVVVCTDVWWLNNNELRECPTISVGGPGINALSAYLGDKVPSAFVVDDSLIVQMDVELTDLLACVWGMNHEQTIAAADVFTERYLDSFMRGVLDRLGDADVSG
ncbi:MAG: hypothetical protein KAS72_07345 [Phycisphaerales bacterium]|nr:hypothetical protein [Phycisphaerales bacterium]